MNKNLITYSSIIASYRSLGYRFRSNPFELNLFGIRSSESESNKFDDIVGGWFVDDKGEFNLMAFDATTDPGKYWLQNPSNRAGTAIVAPGQYQNVYSIGIHGRTGDNPYDAFEQVGEMSYVRDNNLDIKLDFDLFKDPKNIFKANIKSNIHRASRWKILQFVEKYSAACQVIQSASDFEKLLEVGKRHVKITGRTKFDYTLFTEDQFLFG